MYIIKFMKTKIPRDKQKNSGTLIWKLDRNEKSAR